MLKNGIKLVGKRSYPKYILFEDAYLFKDKIYILTSKSRDPDPSKEKTSKEICDSYITILCKNTLNPEKKYLIKLNDDERIHSFAVTEKDGRVIFYAPMFTKEGTDIAVFKEKEPKEKD